MSTTMDKVFLAMSNAAEAIGKTKGVTSVSFDNDNDSGEIMFDVNGKTFILSVEETRKDTDG